MKKSQQSGALSTTRHKIVSIPKIKFIIDKFKEYLLTHKFKRLVIGIYKDQLAESLSAVLLAQHAIEAIDEEDYFVYKVGVAFEKSESSVEDYQLDLSLTVHKALLAVQEFLDSNPIPEGPLNEVIKNLRARIGTVGLYHIAGLVNALVAGTSRPIKSLEEKYPKYGHDAADLMPLAHVNPFEIEALVKESGLSDTLIQKILVPKRLLLEGHLEEARVEGFNRAESVLPLTFSIQLPEDSSQEKIERFDYAHIEIRKALQVQADLSPHNQEQIDIEIRRRIDKLKEYMQTQAIKRLILGVSGGVDSTATGLLAQRAINELNEEQGGGYALYAIRLPYGIQKDESDAQAALRAISANFTYSVNILPIVYELIKSVHQVAAQRPELQESFAKTSHAGFCAGNTKARIRMVVQYLLADLLGQAKVVGTDQASESLMGFFTKYGDGAADIMLISGLTKQQVKAIAKRLGASERLTEKTPTADLEDDKPMCPDEEAFPEGITYSEIEEFLTSDKPFAGLNEKTYAAIIKQYQITQHKRAEPVVIENTSAAAMYSFFDRASCLRSLSKEEIVTSCLLEDRAP